jgi:hypothetical protein
VAGFAAGELAGFALGALGAEFVPDLRRAAARVVGR